LTFPKLKYAFACVATDIINGEQVVLHDGSLIDSVQASISIPGIFTPVIITGRYLVDGGLVNTVPVSVCREMGAGFVIGVNVVPEPSKVMCNPNKDQRYQVCESPKFEETGGEKNSARESRIYNLSLSSRIDVIENASRMLRLSGHQHNGIGVLKSAAISKVKKVRRLRTKFPSLVEVLSQTLTIAEYRVAMENLKDADLAISPDVDEIGFWQFNNAAHAIAAGEYAARIVLEGKNTVGLLRKI
jgi:NTE family protein